jgi:hypothetical protein
MGAQCPAWPGARVRSEAVGMKGIGLVIFFKSGIRMSFLEFDGCAVP